MLKEQCLKVAKMKTVLFCFVVILSCFRTAEAAGDEAVYLMRQLMDSDCNYSMFQGLNLEESSAAVTISPDCARNYLNVKKELFTENEMGLFFRLLSASNRSGVINDFFYLVIERSSHKFVVSVIAEGCLMGGRIDWYKKSYMGFYDDYEDVKETLKDICKK